MARTGLSPEALAQILGPDADKAFLQMLMQDDGDGSPSGLVAPRTAGDGLHNIGVYINSAMRFNAKKAERRELLGLLGKTAAINAQDNGDSFRYPGTASPSISPMVRPPMAAGSPPKAPASAPDFTPSPMKEMGPVTPAIADDPSMPKQPGLAAPGPSTSPMVRSASPPVATPPRPIVAARPAGAAPNRGDVTTLTGQAVSPSPSVSPSVSPMVRRPDPTPAEPAPNLELIDGPRPAPRRSAPAQAPAPQPAQQPEKRAQMIPDWLAAQQSGAAWPSQQDLQPTPDPVAQAASRAVPQPSPQSTPRPVAEPAPTAQPSMAGRSFTEYAGLTPASDQQQAALQGTARPPDAVSNAGYQPALPGAPMLQSVSDAPQARAASDVPPLRPSPTGWVPKSLVLHDYGTPNREGFVLSKTANNPYHTLVYPDGTVRYRNPDDPYGAPAPHAYKMNPESIGLSYAGPVGSDPTPEALDALRRESGRIKQAYPGINVESHGEAYQRTKGTNIQASRDGRDLAEASWRTKLNEGPVQVADASGGFFPGRMSLGGNAPQLEGGAPPDAQVKPRSVKTIPVGRSDQPSSSLSPMVRMPQGQPQAAPSQGYQPTLPERSVQSGTSSQRMTPEQNAQWMAKYGRSLSSRPDRKMWHEQNRPLTPEESRADELSRLQIEKARRDLVQDPNKIGTVKDGDSLYRMNPQTGKIEWITAPGSDTGQSKEYRKAYDKEMGETRAKATVDFPRIFDNSDRALKVIDQILKHPGRSTGTGLSGYVMPHIPGSDAKGFVKLVDQAEGQTFLEAFNSLRGGGAITEPEGKKATLALGRLDRSQSKQDFDAAMADLKDVITTGVARARQMSQGQYSRPDPVGTRPQPETGQSAQQMPTIASPDDARKLPSGTRFRTPDGRVMEVP